MLPNRFDAGKTDPLVPLGKLIAKAIAPVRDEVVEFETVNHFILNGLPGHPKLQAAWIGELNCRQIKGAAQEKDQPSGAAPEQSSAEVARVAPPYADLAQLVNTLICGPGDGLIGYLTTPAKTEAAEAPFLVGDRVVSTENGFPDGVVTLNTKRPPGSSYAGEWNVAENLALYDEKFLRHAAPAASEPPIWSGSDLDLHNCGLYYQFYGPVNAVKLIWMNCFRRLK